ncbi:MAG: photosystem II protein PsbQ [Coleofasciculaceae cyanobacterium]
MKSYRSILAVVLALVTTLLVSCAGPSVATPPVYTSQQIEQIQSTVSNLTVLRERMPELQSYIQNRNWVNADNFIHGPLGDLRRQTGYLTRQLLPQEQEVAKEITKDLFAHLESIGLAASDGKYPVAIKNYQAALNDFDKFLRLVPE